MVLSRGTRRPPVSSRVLRPAMPAILASLAIAVLAGGALQAQPSPSLAFRLRVQRVPVLATGPDPQAPVEIPPGSVIGEVHVAPQDLFDPEKPGENRWFFRLANKLHRTTRPKVIERQLLFRPGDVFSPELVEESARLLRSNDFLYDVDIQPVLRQDGKVDVQVETRDLWSLEGGISFSRAGGSNNTTFSVEDTNLLGTGKELSVSRIGTVDRISNLVRYRDPNLFGGRGRLLLSWADNSDGGRKRFELERPFYSLSTRWAMGLRAFQDDRLERLYSFGKIATGFHHRSDFLEVYGGLSPGLVKGSTRRLGFGFTMSREEFDPSFRLDPKQTAPVPENRTLAYPWVRFESIQNGFVVERDLNRIQRSEDLNLGRQWHVLLGYSSPSFGGIGEKWIAQGAVSSGWRPAPRHLLMAQLGGSTRWAEEGAENLVAGGRIQWYARNFGDQVFYASLGADLARRLDGEDQLLLGGDSGLRGYPLRYQAGDRRVLLTLEQRFFSKRELFHLVHLGAAVFFDAGKAWYVDPPPTPRLEDPGPFKAWASSGLQIVPLDPQGQPLWTETSGKILKDVGLGLRLGSSRSSRGAVVHIDAAFPLDGQRDIERIQWLVATSDTF